MLLKTLYDASYSVVQGVGARRVGDVRRVGRCRGPTRRKIPISTVVGVRDVPIISKGLGSPLKFHGLTIRLPGLPQGQTVKRHQSPAPGHVPTAAGGCVEFVGVPREATLNPSGWRGGTVPVALQGPGRAPTRCGTS